jgi:hypothetical protein
MRPNGARNLTAEESVNGHYIKVVKKICETCGHGQFTISPENGKCYRFPKTEDVERTHFCGEWKKRPR